MSLHVAVAIVGYRDCEDIVRCLAALETSNHHDFEVVICENGGPEAYAELTKALPAALAGGQAVRIHLAPSNIGYAGGVNLCMRETAEADAWWILNPDTAPEPDAMGALAAKLAEGRCAAVGCALYFPNGKVQSHGGHWRGWFAWPISMGYGHTPGAAVDVAAIERQLNYLNGASILVGRRFLETVGPMREDYFLYCEDTDWCLRAVESGLRLGIAPDAIVIHFQGATTGSGGDLPNRSKLSVYLGERNKILLTRDHYPLRLPVAAVCSVVLHVLRCAKQGAWRQLGYGLSGWWAGVGDQRGVPSWQRG